jgi:hypothetical protein
MRRGSRRLVAVALLGLWALWAPPGAATASPVSVAASAAPAEIVAEMRGAVERARQQLEARDQAGILAAVSEHYRSNGMTKAALREQLAAMFALYQQLRARVTVERVAMVEGRAWVYTSGEITGRLPIMGWVTVLSWQSEPEVARREGAGWRLFGFQD